MIKFIKALIKHFKTISFIFGFSIDLFFLPKVTSPLYIWIGPFDIALVFILILIRQIIRKALKKRDKKYKEEVKLAEQRGTEVSRETINEKTSAHKLFERMNNWVTYIVSFFLGTLLSHVLVYYFRSSDILQMWPIFAIIILAILANEFLFGVIPDILLFFIATTFFVIFNVPIFLNKVNSNTFLISILVSVIFTSIMTVILQRIYLSGKEFILLILFSCIFPFVLLRLYYINYIPAVPLALGDSGFYSYVSKDNTSNKTDYIRQSNGLVENKKFFYLKDDYYNFTNIKDNGFYFFSSIISPANVTAEITHVWEKYDYNKKVWVEYNRIHYSVSGGRDDGYRGYSFIQNISEGEWRVRVLADDRLVGLKKITVK